MHIYEIIREQHDKLIVGSAYPQQYAILKDYRGTYIEKDLQKEEKMIHPMFRPFETVKPDRGRNLNIDPELNFDPYTHSLMDYPSIIGYKLNKDWKQFNRLISIQIPLCANNCWHCYVPKELYNDTADRSRLLTAAEIVDKFLEQQEYDKNQDKYSNVLRITGGEPFLLPELIRDCLRQLKEKGREDDIFLWTETNLEPFIGEAGLAFMDQSENKAILKELSGYKNFAVHPCLHGMGEKEFDTVTGKSYHISLDQQVGALKRLLDHNIDIYPTFGSNVCDPSNIKDLFLKLVSLHHNLPLKVALIEYSINYEAVRNRLREEERQVNIYSRFTNIRIWNQLLLETYGIGYAVLPRHLANLYKKDKPIPAAANGTTRDLTSTVPGKEILYFFKSSYRDHYHREILDMLALPSGHIYDAEYEKKWLPDDLFFHMSQFPKAYIGKRITFSYVNMEARTSLPVREAYIENIRPAEDTIFIKFKLDKYKCWGNIENICEKTTALFRKYFGPKNIPPGGKFVLPGEDSIFLKLEKEGNQCGTSEPESLRPIIPKLVSDKRMKKSLFYWITTDGLAQRKENNKNPITIYEIKGGKSFKIHVDYFLPNYEEFDERNPEERTIYFQSSSENISSVGEPKIVLTKYGSEELEFITDKISVKKIVTLTFWSKYDEFRAAKAILQIRLLPTRFKDALSAIAGSILFAVGTGGLALASQAASEEKSLWEAVSTSVNRLFFGVNSGRVLLNILFIGFLGVIFFSLFYLYPRGLPFKK